MQLSERIVFFAATARRLALVLALMGADLGLVRAQEAGEAESAPIDHQAGLRAVDAALQQSPKDPELRFMRALTLHELGRTAEAITMLQMLTEDHPELVEPYNNLAVMYYKQGDYERARLTLERAVRANPNYATAQENLGDIYANLASRAYDQALQLDAGNRSAQYKLRLVQQLLAPPPEQTTKPEQTNKPEQTTKP